MFFENFSSEPLSGTLWEFGKDNFFLKYNLKKIFYSFTHMCIHCLGHFSPLSTTPFLAPPTPLFTGRTCSALISNFVEKKT
jgi:hypothetical protein